MKLGRRHLIWTGAGVAVGALVWLAMREKPLDVDTALVTRDTLQVTVDAEGKTRVRDRYVLTAPVAGRLQRIDMPEGTHLRAGDVVARIAPLPLDAQSVRQAQARLAQAQAMAREAETRVRQARASLDQERRAAGRVVRLTDAGALPERDREEASLSVRLREEELAAAVSLTHAASADVEQARAALLAVGGGAPGAVVSVRAPAAGCVLRIPERSERVVTAGAPIADIGDPGALEIVIDILSSDAARVRAGAPVVIDRWGGEKPLAGRVRTIEPAAFTRVSALGVEEQRVNVIIDVADAPAELGDGYRVEARIITWERPDVVVVPVSALFRVGQDWAAYIVADGRAVLRRVGIGERGGVEAQVASGLEPGNRVIVFPSDQITRGRRVAVTR